jgi:hypothetical protein
MVPRTRSVTRSGRTADRRTDAVTKRLIEIIELAPEDE